MREVATPVGPTRQHVGRLRAAVLSVLLVVNMAVIAGSVTPQPAGAQSFEADFSTAKAYDAAKMGNGASVVSVTSVQGNNLPDNLLLPTSATWQTATGEVTDQQVVVELGGRGTDLIDEVELLGGTGTTVARNVEIALAVDGLHDEDFVTVGSGEVLQSTSETTSFAIAPQRARYLRIRVLDNHGSTARVSLRELRVVPADRAGGIVSLPVGPQARVIDVSSERPANPAVNALNRATNQYWLTLNGDDTDAWLRFELGGEGSHLIDRVVLQGNNTTTDPRGFEVWISETGDVGSFVQILTDEAERSNQPQQFSVPPVQARFAELRVHDNHGGNAIRVHSFQMLTADGLPVADADGVGAAVVDVSAEQGNNQGARALSPAPGEYWQTPSGENTDQHLTALLRNGEREVIDRVMIVATGNRPNNVEVWVSDTGAADAYIQVASGALTNTSNEHWLVFPPVEARLVQLRVRDGFANTVRVNQFRVFSPERGSGDDVSFVDLSSPGAVSWAWNFGDSATSTDQHPTHTFPGPGTYEVQLTITDAHGDQHTRSRPYTVVGAPSVAVVPVAGATTVDERQVVGVRGETTAPVAQWDWSGNDDVTGSTSGPTANVRFPDQGTYQVTVRALSADWVWVESAPLTFEVLNVPPSVFAGPDATTYVGDALTRTNSTATDPADPLVCTWDWGDGTPPLLIDPCTTARTRVPHTYEQAGTYTATLTADDGDGGVTAASAQITVLHRPTFVHVLWAEPDGDDLRVLARLHDARSGVRVPGHEIDVVTAHPAAASMATTDEFGVIDITLPGAGGADEVTVSFAGDEVRGPATQTRPVGWLPEADIVFIIDESNSMGSYQQAVADRVTEIAHGLVPHLDFQLGVVGFAGGYTQEFGHIVGELTDDLTMFTGSLQSLRTSTGNANGYDGVVTAMRDEMGFRSTAASCAVLISDASASEIAGAAPETTKQDALTALGQRNTPLFAVTSSHAISQEAYGVPDGLAGITGGAAWLINQFANDASQVLDALIDGCVTTALTPDVAVTKDSGVDVVGPGEELIYTLTVSNRGAVPLTGIELVDILPEAVAFVGASDGGQITDGVVTWPTFDVGVGGVTERTVTVQTPSGLDVGTYDLVNVVTVTDDGSQGDDRNPADNQDEDLTVLQVLLNQPPVAAFTATPSDGEAPLQVTFTSTSSDPDGDALTLTWDLGDGTVITDGPASVVHTYDTPGVYEVHLTVNDGRQTASASDTVMVSEAIEVTATTRCVAGNVFVVLTARNDEGVPIAVDFDTDHGSRSFVAVAPDRFASHGFHTRQTSLAEDGTATIRIRGVRDGQAFSGVWTRTVQALTC